MGEIERAPRRNTLNRFFFRSGKWYVETREGCQGPFVRRQDAVEHLDRHLRKHGSNRESASGIEPQLQPTAAS